MRESTEAPRIIYISHAFRSDPYWNIERVRAICRRLAADGLLPLAPHLLLPRFIDEWSQRKLAVSYCLRLVSIADELWVFGDVSDGMRQEIAEAHRLRIPVARGEEQEREAK